MTHLTHYTRDIGAVLGILENGFAWAPLPRNLIIALVPNHDWTASEPEQCGMISFTNQPVPADPRHLEAFGNFGIQVRREWAISSGATRVIYLERSGPLFDAMQGLFGLGYQQVTKGVRYPDDGFHRLAYLYKGAASAIAGAPLWAHLLTLYQYLEPADHDYQHEWRVVHPQGVGNLSKDPKERIRQVSPPQNWAKFLHVLRIEPGDVLGFVCPRAASEELIHRLPDAYKHKPVVSYDG